MVKELCRWGSLSSPTGLSNYGNTLLILSPSVGLAVPRRRRRGGGPVGWSPLNDGNTLLGLSTAAEEEDRLRVFRCRSRRRVRYDEEEESYGSYNEEIAMLEMYTQSCREEALIVTAIVDDQEVEVLIFKGFSSCLSQETATDAARSVVPERAVIKSIDRVRCPFDPSNLLYIQKGLSFPAFKAHFISQ